MRSFSYARTADSYRNLPVRRRAVTALSQRNIPETMVEIQLNCDANINTSDIQIVKCVPPWAPAGGGGRARAGARPSP